MIKNKKNISHESEDSKDLESPIMQNNFKEENMSGFNDKENPDAKKEDDRKEEPSDQKKDESELDKKIKEIETLTETMKRRQADFENYKKKMIKNQEEQKKLAIKDFALDIININDDLLRAYNAACNINREKPVDEVCNTFSEGFSMISKRIEDTLKKYGIEEIDSLNKAFDPNYNEAVEIGESEDVKEDTITLVHQKGFRLDDYIIRSAKVKVTRPKKVSPDEESKINSGSAVNHDSDNI